MKISGPITGFRFGCWSDGVCSIRVGDAWVDVVGGKQEQSEPHGELSGVTINGAPPAELEAKQRGMQVEVFAEEQPIFDAQANVSGWDPKRLTLAGRSDYYLRAR